MGSRFRRSVRLFPGVRLNFSGSGVSTTVGPRGATMTFGPQGTHVNVGLPGSGLSHRARVSPPPAPRQAPPQPLAATLWPSPDQPPAATAEFDERLIHSAPVGALTSPGLGELKALINDSAARRRRLQGDIAVLTAARRRAQGRLDLAQGFLTRLMLAGSAPDRARELQAAETRLEEAQAELEGCHIEIDFGLDGPTHGAYQTLTRTFRELCACERIWDITATSRIDRVAERTLASTAIRRTRVSFAVTESEIVRTAEPVLRLANVGGRDLQLHPGFLIMRESNGDFALIEYRELDVTVTDSPFLEEETVPGDAEVIGQTWKKANKDGSRDLRFKENHAIPVVRYAELKLRSDAGLLEAYQFSDRIKAQAFMSAYDAHRRALATLVSRDGPTPSAVDAPPPPPDPVAEEAAAMARVKPPQRLWLDWSAVAAILILLLYMGFSARGEPAPGPQAEAAGAPRGTPSPDAPRLRARGAS